LSVHARGGRNNQQGGGKAAPLFSSFCVALSATPARRAALKASSEPDRPNWPDKRPAHRGPKRPAPRRVVKVTTGKSELPEPLPAHRPSSPLVSVRAAGKG